MTAVAQQLKKIQPQSSNPASFYTFWFLDLASLQSVAHKLIFTGNYLLVAVGLSGILKGKQKIGVTFDSDKLGGIDFTKFSKLTISSA